MNISELNFKSNITSEWNFKEIKIENVVMPNGIDEVLPLIPFQEYMFNLQKANPYISDMNMATYTIFNTPINLEFFIKTFQKILNEQQIYHYTFCEEYGVGFLKLNPRAEYKLLYCDSCNSEEKIMDFMKKNVALAFNIYRQLALFILFKVSDEKYYLYMKVHHTMGDGACGAIIANAMKTTYEQLINGEELNLKQSNFYYYSDFVKRFLTYKASPQYEKDRQYWLNLLNHFSTTSLTNCIHVQSNPVSTNGSLQIIVHKEVLQKIRDFCKKNSTTSYHYFMASSFLLNYLYGNAPAVIRTPVLNRSSLKDKNTVGLFVNDILCGIDFIKTESFIDLIKRVRDHLLINYAHKSYSYSDLRKELESITTPVNMVVSYQAVQYAALFNGKPTMTRLIHNGHQSEDLVIQIMEHLYDLEQGAVVMFNYNPNSFSEEGIRQLMKDFQSILTLGYEKGDLPLQELPSLPPIK